MNNTANKKDIFYIIVLILTFITVVVGATFALYAWFFSQEEGTSAVYTGTFSIEYLSGDKINFDWLYPTEKPTIDTVKNVYKNNFKVTNTGSLDGEIEIYIDIKKNDFPTNPNRLKYSLYDKEEKEVIEGDIEVVYDKETDRYIAKIASNLELKNNSTESYTLLIWIEETGENQPDEMKKSLIGTIVVDAMQKKEFK